MKQQLIASNLPYVDGQRLQRPVSFMNAGQRESGGRRSRGLASLAERRLGGFCFWNEKKSRSRRPRRKELGSPCTVVASM